MTRENIQEDLSGLVNLAICYGTDRQYDQDDELRDEVFSEMEKIVDKLWRVINRGNKEGMHNEQI